MGLVEYPYSGYRFLQKSLSNFKLITLLPLLPDLEQVILKNKIKIKKREKSKHCVRELKGYKSIFLTKGHFGIFEKCREFPRTNFLQL